MDKIKELFAKHPYLIGGGAVVVFVIFYYLFSRSSSGSVTTTGTSSTDAQTAALDAQQNIAQLQAQTQLAGLQIQAGVQSQQITAAQDVATQQVGAELQALQSNNDTQVQLAQVQAGQNEAQVKALEDIVTAQYTAQTDATNAAYSYLTTANTNATNLQAYAIGQQSTLSQQALSHVKDVGGSQNRTSIILSALGNPQAANTAAAGQTISSVSGDSLLSNITKGATSAFSSLLG